MKISKHISYKEATRSATAARLGIDNTPGQYELQNMQLLADKVFEPLREHFGVPIFVSSFYRSDELNKAVHGSSRSQHREGRAMDLDDVLGGVTNAQIFRYIKDKLDYDVLIWEFGDDNNPDWVHVSYVGEDQNRKHILRATRRKGKTIYEQI